MKERIKARIATLVKKSNVDCRFGDRLVHADRLFLFIADVIAWNAGCVIRTDRREGPGIVSTLSVDSAGEDPALTIFDMFCPGKAGSRFRAGA